MSKVSEELSNVARFNRYTSKSGLSRPPTSERIKFITNCNVQHCGRAKENCPSIGSIMVVHKKSVIHCVVLWWFKRKLAIPGEHCGCSQEPLCSILVVNNETV